MENILVTGGSGFLGSQLAMNLAQDPNLRVVCLVKDKNYRLRRDLEDHVSVVSGDLRDFDSVRFCMSRYEIDTVFHLAATTIIKQSVVDPITTYACNTMGTVHVLEAARQMGDQVEKTVVASSDKAYADQPVMPYVEGMPMTASDPYSTSKACTDLISQSYAKTYGMNVSVVRCGNIYGEGDMNRTRLIPRAICNILRGKPPIIYKGVGEYRREWMYVGDVIEAYKLVCNRGGAGEAYNVGGSGFCSVFDTVDIILDIMDTDIKPKLIDKSFIEIKEQWLDATKLKALGWSCKYSLKDGLVPTIAWYKQYIENGGIEFYG